MKQVLVSMIGAVIGGTLGFYGFRWLHEQGYYGLILPGGLLGIGASFGKTRSLCVPVACSIAALALGLFSEWCEFPFVADKGFGYFLRHLTDLKLVTLIMLAVGTALAFWMPFRHADNQNPPAGK
jgi:hypothetical protein